MSLNLAAACPKKLSETDAERTGCQKQTFTMFGTIWWEDVSIKMINSTLSANNDEDMYATLDILILDLYQGNIEFIKNGACPTYIKRNKEVKDGNTNG